MKDLSNKTSPSKNLFRTIYCQDCKQAKSCGKLNPEYCCQCCYKNQQERWIDYLTYEKALAYEKQQQKDHERNLRLLQKGETPEQKIVFADWKKFYRQKS
jgi:hypothetical protein